MLLSFVIGLGLGLLVGLHREWEHDPLAGTRTFALARLFGAPTASSTAWVIAAALVALSTLIVPGYLASTRKTGYDPGLTTDLALLITFATTVLTVMGYRMLAVVAAASVMVLLQGNQVVHAIGENDLHETARMVLISLVILPLLLNKPYCYEGVLNPFSMWLMLVLIVGTSLAAYLAAYLAGKFLGNARGMAGHHDRRSGQYCFQN